MDINKEREAFEHAFSKTGFYKGMLEALKNPDCPFTSVFEMRGGEYRSTYVALSFEIWKAAKAHEANKQGQEILTHERLQELIAIGVKAALDDREQK